MLIVAILLLYEYFHLDLPLACFDTLILAEIKYNIYNHVFTSV